MKDRERANELRESNRTIISFDSPRPAKDDFPYAMQVAGNYRVEVKDGKNFWLEEKENDGWVKFHQQMARARSYYFRKGKKRKDGTYGEQRFNTKGVIDTYVTVPKWWTQAISERLRSGDLQADDVKHRLKQISCRLILKHEQRTGYEGLYAAVHPDSTDNLQIHLGVGTVDPTTHKLIGRSAGGKRGKRGLKELGDCFLYVWNLSHLGELPKKALHLPKLCFEQAKGEWTKGKVSDIEHPFDDVALACFLEKKLIEEFPECAIRATELGKEAVVAFSSTVETKMQTKPELLKENAVLKEKSAKDKKEIARLKSLIPKKGVDVA
jgi:hypothetical protein